MKKLSVMVMKILLLVTLKMIAIYTLSAQIQHAEPPFWWAGMRNPELQIMVHGENIAQYEVDADYPGLVIKTISRLHNPNYLFLDLELGEDIQPGSIDLIFKKDGKAQFNYKYELLERQEDASGVKGFDNSDVVYLLMPDRFANGNPSNDVITSMKETEVDRNAPYGRHGGDIQGIIDHMDYFEEMGFTSLWLNPVLENDMPEASYHGYAITDFYKVDPRFGDNQLYKSLAEEADKRGIKLIMDMIFNHCGSEHWWMDDLPSDDWIHYYPDYKITNHRRTVNQDPYASESDLKLMREGWFVPSMPDLNQQNPFLAEYLIQNSIWWIEYLGLEGIRMDTYPYPNKYMMAEWCKRVMDEYPDFNIVGEEWTTNPVIIAYWQKGKENYDGYESNLPSVMDFPLQEAVSKGLNEEESWGTGLIRMYESLANDFIYPDPDNIMVFPDNHDMPRFYMQLGMNKDLYKLGVMYFLTTRGIPQFLYGGEILMTHKEGDGHGYIRKDFPGGWEGDKMNAFTGENMDEEALEMQEFFKTLLNWRKENPVVHSGKLMHYAPEDNVYVLFRYNENEKVMIILNKNTDKYELKLDRFKEQLGNSTKVFDVISQEEKDLGEKMMLEPLRGYVLEIVY